MALFPSDYLDPPELLDASVTPIPGRDDPPLKIVDKLSSFIHWLYVMDGIGTTSVIVWSGKPGQALKRQAMICGATSKEVPVRMEAGETVYVTAADPAPITDGTLDITFMGEL